MTTFRNQALAGTPKRVLLLAMLGLVTLVVLRPAQAHADLPDDVSSSTARGPVLESPPVLVPAPTAGEQGGTVALQLVLGGAGTVCGFLPGALIGATPGLAMTGDPWSAPSFYGIMIGGALGSAAAASGGVVLAGRMLGRKSSYFRTFASGAVGALVGYGFAEIMLSHEAELLGGLAGGLVGAIVGWHLFEDRTRACISTSRWYPMAGPRWTAGGRLDGMTLGWTWAGW